MPTEQKVRREDERQRADSETGSSEGDCSKEGNLSDFLHARLERQTRRMVDYLSAQGLEHPPIATDLDTPEGLIDYYNELAVRLRPAYPRLLSEMDSPEERKRHDRNSAWLTGIFTGLALLALAGTGWGLVQLGSGVSTQITLLGSEAERVAKVFFDVSVAALGAILAVFVQVQAYVTKNIYSKRYNTTYVAKFVSGIISGFILAELLSVTLGSTAGASGLLDFGVGAAALIGGASAPVVYNIIKRLSEATERMFVDRAAAREAEMRKTLGLQATLQTYRAREQALEQVAAYRGALESLDPEGARELDEMIRDSLDSSFVSQPGPNDGRQPSTE